MSLTTDIKSVRPSVLSGTVDIIRAKAHLHRLIIAAALSSSPVQINGVSDAEDIARTVDCVTALGCRVAGGDDGYTIYPPENYRRGATLPCGESGSTLRFLLPVAAALGTGATFTSEGRLGARPLSDLTAAITEGGATVNIHSAESVTPLTVSGKMRGGEYTLPGNVSSQYITGMLFALPLLSADSTLTVKGDISGKGYVDITLSVLREFGIKIDRTRGGFHIPGNQRYTAPAAVTADGDWSNAAFFLAAGALCGDVTVTGLNPNSAQGDRAICDILRNMGAEISVSGGSVRVKKSPLSALTLDADDIPDLVPVVSVLCAAAHGQSVIRGVERLIYKESDRLAAVIDMLTAFGIAVTYDGGALIIKGGSLTACTPPLPPDHRMVMAATVAGLAARAGGATTITHPGSAAKSQPGFFDDIISIGGQVS